MSEQNANMILPDVPEKIFSGEAAVLKRETVGFTASIIIMALSALSQPVLRYGVSKPHTKKTVFAFCLFIFCFFFAVHRRARTLSKI